METAIEYLKRHNAISDDCKNIRSDVSMIVRCTDCGMTMPFMSAFVIDDLTYCGDCADAREQILLSEEIEAQEFRFGKNEPKHYPKPKYNKCNKGHTLVEVYDERRNAFVWDCPICQICVKG